MAQQLFTPEDLRTILKNLTKTSTAKYISSHLKSLFTDGNVEGFLGEYFILEIKYELENESRSENLFVKKEPSKKEFQIEMASSWSSYNKEIFYLDVLMKEYEKYGFDTNFAPKCYFSKNGKLLVLENLSLKQFALPEKYKYFDLDQCKAGLLALAQYHGASILYEETKSKELGAKFTLDKEYPELLTEKFYNLASADEIHREILQKGSQSILHMIEELKTEKSYKEDFKNKIVPEDMLSVFFHDSKYKKATGHGDLWFKNIFFKSNDSKSIQCRIIDYQILRYFYPAYDILIFLYLNTSKQFRKTNLSMLLQYYYQSLSEMFIKHGFKIDDIFPINEFKESLNYVNCAALYNSIGTSSLVLLSDQVLKMFMNDESVSFDNQFVVLCESFTTDLIYRKMITELIDELHDVLYSDTMKQFF